MATPATLFSAALLFCAASTAAGKASLSLVANTWAFTEATETAWASLVNDKSTNPALDAVTEGCRFCEQTKCDLTVGFGGSPDEEGETTLDAMIMDGETMETGAIGSLRHCKEAILTARRVLEHTKHSLLTGLQATAFAVEMGLALDNLTTDESYNIWRKWRENNCQPNFRRRVTPPADRSCGPYKPVDPYGNVLLDEETCGWVRGDNHDTISMVAIDGSGRIAAGSSSNGASHKVPGRVGDASIAGGGAYAQSGIGGCASTGDGDLHMRFLPCYQVVESMRLGYSPRAAAEDAVNRILKYYPHYVGALLAVDASGKHAGAAAGWTFKYSVKDSNMDNVEVVSVPPLNGVDQGAVNEACAAALDQHSEPASTYIQAANSNLKNSSTLAGTA